MTKIKLQDRTRIEAKHWRAIRTIIDNDFESDLLKQLKKTVTAYQFERIILLSTLIQKCESASNKFTRINHFQLHFEDCPIIWTHYDDKHLFSEDTNDYMLIAPQKGAQYEYLNNNIPTYVWGTRQINYIRNHTKMCGNGGAAGTGKTYSLLVNALKYICWDDYLQVFFREQYKDVMSTFEEGRIVYRQLINNGDLDEIKGEITCPMFNSKIEFSYINEQNYLSLQGRQLGSVTFEEICQLEKAPVFYAIGRNRYPHKNKAIADKLTYVNYSCNPDPHHFLKDMLEAGEFLNHEGQVKDSWNGKKMYFIHANEEFDMDEDADILQSRHSKTNALGDYITKPVSFKFYRGHLHENLYLASTDYESTLSMGTASQRKALLEGSWNQCDNPNSLYDAKNFADNRIQEIDRSEVGRCIVSVDPAMTSANSNAKGKRLPDSAGIVALARTVGDGDEAKGIILADRTSVGKKVDDYLKDACILYREVGADMMLVESNQGSELLTYAIQQIDPDINAKLHYTSDSKEARARSITPLYSANRISHMGYLQDLEDEMIAFDPDKIRKQGSPGRLDALSHGLRELFADLLKQKTIKNLSVESMFIPPSDNRDSFSLGNGYNPFDPNADSQPTPKQQTMAAQNEDGKIELELMQKVRWYEAQLKRFPDRKQYLIPTIQKRKQKLKDHQNKANTPIWWMADLI
ncbi:terminase large subunit domain-containing protein [Endozoicomonas sp. ALB032]|uniref:terminase large subunit domain-containing protein n=1 Tax=Endozoicomonas sp. ALB032 TaxID=3403082 RepID=UPI003BB6F0CD